MVRVATVVVVTASVARCDKKSAREGCRSEGGSAHNNVVVQGEEDGAVKKASLVVSNASKRANVSPRSNPSCIFANHKEQERQIKWRIKQGKVYSMLGLAQLCCCRCLVVDRKILLGI